MTTDLPAPELLSVPVRGGALAVARWGRGGPVVLAPHGITANHVGWTYVAAALGDEVTLLAPDLRGRGLSADLPGPWGMATHVSDLVAVLDHLGVDHAAVAGHSMGAFVAVKAAGLHPARFPSLLLVDGGIRLAVPPSTSVDDVLHAVLGPAMDRLATSFPTREAVRDHWRRHPAFLRDWNPLVEAYVDHDVHEVDGAFRSRVRPEAVREDGRDTLTDASLTAFLDDGPVPMRLLWAPRGTLDADPLYPRELVDARAAELDHLTVVHAEDVNHYTVLLAARGAAQVADQVRALISA